MNPSITPQDRRVRLNFSGGSTEQHYLLATDLAVTVGALRRTVQLATLKAQSVESRNLDRIPLEMRRQFGLYIAAPTSGSLVFDGVIGGPLEPLGAEEGITRVLRLFKTVGRPWCEVTGPRLDALLPDRMRRQRWVDAAARSRPVPGAAWPCVWISAMLSLRLADVPQRLAALRERQTPAVRESLINGYLAEIDFLDRTFSLRYPVGDRLVSGSYNETVFK